MKPRKHRPHWYFIYYWECPVCWRYESLRERRYTPRPEKWEDRHEINLQAYDWCLR